MMSEPKDGSPAAVVTSISALVIVMIALAGTCSMPGDNTNQNDNGLGNVNQNDNVNGNDNGNTNDNTNQNVNGNTNDNTNTNQNDNQNDNGNDDCLTGFTLTVEIVTAGAGSVALDPTGPCYAAETQVGITAAAEPTFTFVGFSGDASGTEAAASLTMDADKSITAAFTGNCFVASGTAVLEFDPLTGSFLGEFVAAGAGGLDLPQALAFGPDGDLFVSTPDDVLKYDGASGAFVEQFVSPGEGGLTSAFGLDFGSNGNLFLAAADRVLEYGGSSGAFMQEFVAAGDGGLGGATALRFGPNGNLFVAATPGGPTAGAVFEFDGATGAFIDDFIPPGGGGLGIPFDMVFDLGGDLFISVAISGQVKRYDGVTGDPVGCPCLCLDPCPDDAFPAGSYEIGGLSFPAGLAFAANGDLLVVAGGSVRAFALPATGPAEQAPFVPADPGQFEFGTISSITFKPLP